MELTYNRLVILTAALLVAGCSESPSPTDLPPQMAISDGAHAGNQNFFFLRPMVPTPSPTGTFDGTLEPEVQVCVWDGSACAATLAIFNIEAGSGSETVRVSTVDEHYIVNWHTAEILDNYTLGAGETFRVRVLVQGQELGFADLAVVGSGKELKNVNTNELVALLDGRTLPIKFRVEEGALGVEGQGEIASAGRFYSCAVATNGDAYCWGRNRGGVLGIGFGGGTFLTPQLVTGGHTFQSVQTALRHACGLTTSGQMLCWGLNTFGGLGTGTTDFFAHPTPTLVIGGHMFSSLAALGGTETLSTCGVTTTGDMLCWGLNTNGELGRGTFTISEPIPGLVIGGHTFAGSAAMERRHTCGVTTAGDIACWGRDDVGQLGDGTVSFPVSRSTPTLVVGGHTFESVTAGANHTCGINTAGAALCWGRNAQGELGIGMFSPGIPTPQFVIGGHTFTQLSGGWMWGCGVRTDGAGLCWGSNSSGQLGRGTFGGSFPTPGLVVGSHTFRAIGAGFNHACGVTTTGDTFCWGNNANGQLGNGTFASNATPQFAIDLDPTVP